MAEYAPGIPDKYVYGEPTKALQPGQLATYVLQHHRTKRRPGQPHYDLRIGTPGTNLFSWAIPGAELPEEGKKTLAPQTQLHSYGYGNFEGPIREGYGSGMVTMADKGQVLVRKVQPNALHFTIAHTKIPTRYALVQIGGKNGRDWLLVHKAEPSSVPGVGDKPKYKLIEAVDLDDAIEQASEVQEKIDGAHQIYQVGPEGNVEAYSVNPRVTGEPIRHSERAGLTNIQVPKELSGTVLRGEIYATKGQKAIPFQELSGLLNASVAKSVETQRVKKLQIRNMIFDILKHKGKDVSEQPFGERKKLLEDVVGKLPQDKFHLPLSATDAAEKRRIFEDIQAGRNPRTSEGIIMHMPDNKIWKYKLRPEAKGYITDVFPGKAGRTGMPGGVEFATEPGGKAIGRLGSGFTMDELKDIAKNLAAYKNRPMRVSHTGQFETGKFRQPVFAGWETDVKESEHKSWIGVDLDGTLARYNGFKGPEHIGTPIPKMLDRVKRWLKERKDVRIFTARASDPKAKEAIKKWCQEHLGKTLKITNVKDHKMSKLWDDRAVSVEKNTGEKKAQTNTPAIQIPGWLRVIAPSVDIPKVNLRGATTNLSQQVTQQLADSWRMQLAGADKDVIRSNRGLKDFYSRVPVTTQQQMDKAVSSYVAPHVGTSVNAAEFGPSFLQSMQKAVPGLARVAPLIEKGQGTAAAQAFVNPPVASPTVAKAAPMEKRQAVMKVAASPIVKELLRKAMVGAPVAAVSGYSMVDQYRAQKAMEDAWSQGKKPFMLPWAPGDTKTIVSLKDLDNYLSENIKNPLTRIAVKAKAREMITGRNRNAAFYAPSEAGKLPSAIFASREAPAQAFLHEGGHAKGFQQDIASKGESKAPSRFLSMLAAPFVGIKGTPLWKEENRAWQLSNVDENDPLRRAAMGTYESGLRQAMLQGRVGIPGSVAVQYLQDNPKHLDALRKVLKGLFKFGAESGVSGAWGLKPPSDPGTDPTVQTIMQDTLDLNAPRQFTSTPGETVPVNLPASPGPINRARNPTGPVPRDEMNKMPGQRMIDAGTRINRKSQQDNGAANAGQEVSG